MITHQLKGFDKKAVLKTLGVVEIISPQQKNPL